MELGSGEVRRPIRMIAALFYDVSFVEIMFNIH